MPLPSNLNTNEVKNSSGVEVEFLRRDNSGPAVEFAQSSENPALTHRLKVSHQETGTLQKKRRRSAIIIDKTVISGVDSVTPVTIRGVMYLDIPVGMLNSLAEPTHVLAELLSFAATTGAATTVLFDGTGTGGSAIINGTL